MTDHEEKRKAMMLQVIKGNAIAPWPIGWLVQKGIDSLNGAIAKPENQSEAVASAIRAGKDSGVDEMEISMAHEAGLNLKAPIEGINISMKAGSEGTITMKVKYK